MIKWINTGEMQLFVCLLASTNSFPGMRRVQSPPTMKGFQSQTCFLVAFVSDSGLDASPPASTHELTIPNDVSKSF